jgi:hypothetical protein
VSYNCRVDLDRCLHKRERVRGEHAVRALEDVHPHAGRGIECVVLLVQPTSLKPSKANVADSPTPTNALQLYQDTERAFEMLLPRWPAEIEGQLWVPRRRGDTHVTPFHDN